MPRKRPTSNSQPPNQPVVKGAYITGIFTVIAAIVIGTFHLLGTVNQTQKQGDAVPTSPSEAKKLDQDQSTIDLRPKPENSHSTASEIMLPPIDESSRLSQAMTESPDPHSKSSDSQPLAEPGKATETINEPLFQNLTLRHGQPVQVEEKLVLSANFRQTLGTQHIEIIIAGGQEAERIPAMAAGVDTSLTVGGRSYQLSILTIDWDARSTNILIQER